MIVSRVEKEMKVCSVTRNHPHAWACARMNGFSLSAGNGAICLSNWNSTKT